MPKGRKEAKGGKGKEEVEDTSLDADFGPTDSGSSKTYPKQCSALRKNDHVMIKGKVCKIVEMSTSKTGKHGHAKVHLVGMDIFEGKKLEDICPSTHNMEVPHVNNKTYSLVQIEDGFASLMDDNGEIRDDLKISGQVYEDVKDNPEGFVVTVISANGDEKIMSAKPCQKSG